MSALPSASPESAGPGNDPDSAPLLGAHNRTSTSSNHSLPSLFSPPPPPHKPWPRSLVAMTPRARHSLGMLLLGLVVLLWVSSSFLTHAIFADNTYQKPYFVTYINTSVFTLYLIPIGLRWYRARTRGLWLPDDPEEALTVGETARLSMEFCTLWFLANYLSSHSLSFTSVASATILQSTSAVWTLLLGAVMALERVTRLKSLAVMASLVGVALVSTTDIGGGDGEDGGSRQGEVEHTPLEVLAGDIMALLSAVAYATYITLLKVRVGNEDRIRMQLFFGFVGLFNIIFLWPGLMVLHFTGVERFSLPSDGRVWVIVAINAGITLVSDYCWAYAMLLTTPLVVTLGLSLTIPLAMLGEMALGGGLAGVWYWVGAVCVFGAFWSLDRENSEATAAETHIRGLHDDEEEEEGE